MKCTCDLDIGGTLKHLASPGHWEEWEWPYAVMFYSLILFLCVFSLGAFAVLIRGAMT